ncbi:Acyl-CoA synthetase (AMP-forming)/AMP-acid ligase II [Thermomonospora echinospora]|uniref:Acyl-CoA synthetase (AMP-forming)/AMP-acid ligase II n=1 Tax=Thermomonospora echinospora TaxID=1992 RepID=A0A1H5T450_9ACTN|nr:class I adenylate-forming enzyme family protein [Thermomonospora echinospora]SEF57566.1 Acyl-CoA synthetase (AMP-forming)/AMP-acid ligase II [Thermomonospora echinospora]
MTETATTPVTLTWHADERLGDDLRALLCGPGGPFERRVEPVLGVPTEVFAQRAPNVPAVLKGAVERTPDLTYLAFADGPGRGFTYAQVLQLAAAHAEVLATRYGVGKGDRVAIAAANGLEHVLTIWATVSLGAVVVGLNGWWTPDELDHGIALTDPAVVLGAGKPLTRLRQTRAASSAVSLEELYEAATSLADPPATLPDVEIDEDDPAAIMFTSGTTGRPKGATLSHRNFVHFGMFGGLGGAVAALLGAGGRQVPPGVQRASICSNPLFHVSGVCVVLCNSPMYGIKLVFPPQGRWDAEAALRLTHEHKLTQWTGVPTHFWRMLTHPGFERYDTSQVTTIGSGGATFAPELLRLFEEKMPGIQITNGYGMTETTGTGTFLNGREMDGHPASVGAAAPTIKVQVRDPDGRPLPEGEVGEVHISGAGVFLGYWRDPEATAKVLTGDRWYRSGDYGRITGGVLYLESRMRDLIIRGGENIYPIEIEYRLVEHPDIHDAAVIGVPHTILGQEVKAFVVPRRGAELTEQQIRDWVAVSLASFKVPAHVEFRTELPYNETGKVIKRQLESG